jgi:nucleoid DNA-binding protein
MPMATTKDTEKKPLTKSQLFTSLAEQTGLTKKEVTAVFDALEATCAKELGKRGPGSLTIPSLCKIVKVHKERRPAQKNVRNPFTGEMQDRPAKPAHNVVKVRPLKKLKDMV